MAPQTFVDILEARAAAQPDTRAFLYLRNGEEEEESITFRELRDRVVGAAARLSALTTPGDRAILLYPQGLDFLVAFFGCQYAGVVPVPVSLPNRQRGINFVRGIASDSGSTCLLSETSLLAQVGDDLGADQMLAALPRLDTRTWPGRAEVAPAALRETDLALLQYTSGSTGAPRGVAVTHANLVANQRQIAQGFGHDETTILVSWLPMFHDMGLAVVLQAVWLGAPCTLMSPGAFLQKPERWLRAITCYRATTSGAPDFAYDLCVRRAADRREGLDLASWRTAFNGAEPVRASTLDRFTEVFAPCGFRREVFHPVYGLAEATVFVSSEDPRHPPSVRGFSADGLEEGRVEADRSGSPSEGRPLVSCGHGWPDTRIVIADPETSRASAPGRVGEIWVAGACVAAGYWRKPDDTEATFRATIADDGARQPATDGLFLRTGDLGFIDRGQLFITGRHKDLIIIRGRNHYPQDIEATAGASHPAIEPYGCAAFAIDGKGGEKLVIVQEVRRDAPPGVEPGELVRAIRGAVSEIHSLHVQAVVLLQPMTLPRTSSGKVRRKACRQEFLAGTLPAIASWVFRDERPVLDAGSERDAGVATTSQTADALIAWLRQYAATRINSRTIDERRTFPPSLVLDFGNRGLLGMQVGTEYGGLGLRHLDTLRVLEQLAAIDLTIGLFVGLNNYLGIRPIARHAPGALRNALLPRLATGRELAAFALTEPGAGSNPRALATRAVADGHGRWRLYGTKYWSGAAQWAAVIVVFARHPETAKVSAFCVPQDAEGLRQGPEALTLGMRGLIQNAVLLDGVLVGSDNVLGEPGSGMDVAHDAMMHARLAIGAASVGAMKRCAQLALRYASRRDVATGRLLTHPVTLERLGRVTAGITALECLVHGVAHALDAGASVPVEGFTACKTAGPELLWQAVDDLAQLVGGRGYIETNLVPQLIRDARVLRIFEGPTETMTALLGARLLGGGGDIKQVIGAILGAPQLTGQVDTIAATVRERAGRLPDALRRDSRAVHWTHARAGELVTWLLLLAAVEGRRAVAASGELDRSAEWVRAQFETTLAAVRDGLPTERATLDVTDLTKTVASFASAIGDVEQRLPSEEQTVDPLLARATPSPVKPPVAPDAAAENTTPPMPPHARLRDWLVTWLADRLRIAPSTVDPSRSFADHGLDSLTAVELAQDLSDHLGCPFDETLLWNFATIDLLVGHLERRDADDRLSAGTATPASDGAEIESRLDQEIARLERVLQPGSTDHERV